MVYVLSGYNGIESLEVVKYFFACRISIVFQSLGIFKGRMMCCIVEAGCFTSHKGVS